MGFGHPRLHGRYLQLLLVPSQSFLFSACAGLAPTKVPHEGMNVKLYSVSTK